MRSRTEEGDKMSEKVGLGKSEMGRGRQYCRIQGWAGGRRKRMGGGREC